MIGLFKKAFKGAFENFLLLFAGCCALSLIFCVAATPFIIIIWATS